MQIGVTQATAAVGRGLCKERGHRCRPNTCVNTCKPSHFFPLTISTLPPSPLPHFPQRSFSSLDFFLPLFFLVCLCPCPHYHFFPHLFTLLSSPLLIRPFSSRCPPPPLPNSSSLPFHPLPSFFLPLPHTPHLHNVSITWVLRLEKRTAGISRVRAEWMDRSRASNDGLALRAAGISRPCLAWLRPRRDACY